MACRTGLPPWRSARGGATSIRSTRNATEGVPYRRPLQTRSYARRAMPRGQTRWLGQRLADAPVRADRGIACVRRIATVLPG